VSEGRKSHTSASRFPLEGWNLRFAQDRTQALAWTEKNRTENCAENNQWLKQLIRQEKLELSTELLYPDCG
jgi:hypothetical protein